MPEVDPDLLWLAEFVNTRDVESGIDTIDHPEGLWTWLVAHDLAGDDSAMPGEPDVERAKTLREGLRAILLAHNHAQADQGAIHRLNELLRDVPFYWRCAPDGRIEAVPLSDLAVRAGLAEMLARWDRAAQHPGWTRLKACRNAACQWAFYDHSRNRSHQWCSMAACGSVMKARRYRARKRAREAPAQARASRG